MSESQACVMGDDSFTEAGWLKGKGGNKKASSRATISPWAVRQYISIYLFIFIFVDLYRSAVGVQMQQWPQNKPSLDY